MLTIVIPSRELYDEERNVFFNTKEYVLNLEHSLVSLSKWESKYCKPFLKDEDRTRKETLDYIQFMTITQNVDPMAYKLITSEIMDTVNEYIKHPMTATTFAKDFGRGKNREIITSEIIYYWMTMLNIPFECQKWHLNRLLTLINVCQIKNQPKKKMGKREAIARQRALNAERRFRLGSTG